MKVRRGLMGSPRLGRHAPQHGLGSDAPGNDANAASAKFGVDTGSRSKIRRLKQRLITIRHMPATHPEPSRQMSTPGSIGAPALRRGFSLLVGLAALAVFIGPAMTSDHGRPDVYYLAVAFLLGRTWLEQAISNFDVVVDGARVFVPFAPFPAVVLAPLVAVLAQVQGPQATVGSYLATGMRLRP
jgi:hypothetical protein